MLLLNLIGLACIGVLWINAEPTIVLRNRIYKWWYGCREFDHKWHWKLINCALCISFWIGIIFTWSILQAAIISVLAEILHKKINKW